MHALSHENFFLKKEFDYFYIAKYLLKLFSG